MTSDQLIEQDAAIRASHAAYMATMNATNVADIVITKICHLLSECNTAEEMRKVIDDLQPKLAEKD